MRKQNRAGLHKELGFLALILLLAGCCAIPETDPSRYKCEWIDDGKSWSCIKDGITFDCEYTGNRTIQ